MSLEKAAAYVQAQGDAIERARLAAVLWEEPPPETALQQLADLQRPDGGFAHSIPEVSTVCDTASVLLWFDDLKVHRAPVVDSACRFLLDRQQEDGGWDEVEPVRGRNPPEWMVPGRIETRVWLTAHCAHVLIRFGYAEATGTFCPTDYLLAHRDETGRMAGYLRATWIALPMLAFYAGPDPASFDRAVAVVQANYSSEWCGSYLAWMLRCLQDARLPAGHSLVARSLADLEHKQRPDGSWKAEQGEPYAARATVEAVRVLKGYGRI